jgi:hypothetical protein
MGYDGIFMINADGRALSGRHRKTSRRTSVHPGYNRIPRVEGQLLLPLVRAQFSFCGRCWVRTNVGDAADGFTDRHPNRLSPGRIAMGAGPWDGIGIRHPLSAMPTKGTLTHVFIRDELTTNAGAPDQKTF